MCRILYAKNLNWNRELLQKHFAQALVDSGGDGSGFAMTLTIDGEPQSVLEKANTNQYNDVDFLSKRWKEAEQDANIKGDEVVLWHTRKASVGGDITRFNHPHTLDAIRSNWTVQDKVYYYTGPVGYLVHNGTVAKNVFKDIRYQIGMHLAAKFEDFPLEYLYKFANDTQILAHHVQLFGPQVLTGIPAEIGTLVIVTPDQEHYIYKSNRTMYLMYAGDRWAFASRFDKEIAELEIENGAKFYKVPGGLHHRHELLDRARKDKLDEVNGKALGKLFTLPNKYNGYVQQILHSTDQDQERQSGVRYFFNKGNVVIVNKEK